MALKFRRRQKIFPGFYLNFSSKGISTTVGIKGLSVNFNKNGTYLNAGIPGSGLYQRRKIAGKERAGYRTQPTAYESSLEVEKYLFLPTKLEGEIKSKDANEVTSQGLLDLKETLLAAYGEKREIEQEIIQFYKQVENAKTLRLVSKLLIIGFFVKWFEDNYFEKLDYLDELNSQLDECIVHIDIELEDHKSEKYDQLKKAFDQLTKSQKIWDMTSAIENTNNRSSASQSITRDTTNVGLRTIPFLNADYEAMYFENKNGSDLYVYPGFVALFDDKKNFGLVELKDLEIRYSESNFLEEQNVPIDTAIIGSTWAKVNKNGTPDKRFKGNYEIPIVRYGELKFKSNTGVYEVFLFSNAESGKIFENAYEQYR